MKICAVIDTNVLVAALITKHEDAATVRVLKAVLGGQIVPLYHEDILAEYDDVLHRKKFYLREETIQSILKAWRIFGKKIVPTPTGTILPDMDDLIFYEVAMEKRSDNAWLVTGNQKHYPVEDFIITPSEMMEILEKDQ